MITKFENFLERKNIEVSFCKQCGALMKNDEKCSLCGTECQDFETKSVDYRGTNVDEKFDIMYFMK